MDPQIKRRLKFDIGVYPCLGKEDGDPVFGDLITLKGYEATKVGTTITRGGQTYNVTSVIYMDGENANQVHVDDEIVSVVAGRLPVKLIEPFPGLGSGYEVMVIYL
jgi:hypothetical protein